MKNLNKFFLKVEENIASFRKQKIYQREHEPIQQLLLIDAGKRYVVAEYRYFHHTEEVMRSISDKEIVALAKTYLEEGGKDIHLRMAGKVRQKSAMNLLFKEELTSPVLERYVELLLNFDSLDNLTVSFECLGENLVKCPGKQELAKKVVDGLASHALKQKEDWKNHAYLYGMYFSNICHYLKPMKFEKSDYHIIHKLFGAFEDIIKEQYNIENSYIRFLKDHVRPSDWEEFKKYSSEKETVKTKTTDIFSENENPTYLLVLNESLIRENNPIISLANDYDIMIDKLVKHINLCADDLGVKGCYLVGKNDFKTEMYFVSKDENPVSKDTIKNLLTYAIEGYVECLNSSEDVSDDFLATTFRAALLSVRLNEGKKEDKKAPQRRNKI